MEIIFQRGHLRRTVLLRSNTPGPILQEAIKCGQFTGGVILQGAILPRGNSPEGNSPGLRFDDCIINLLVKTSGKRQRLCATFRRASENFRKTGVMKSFAVIVLRNVLT